MHTTDWRLFASEKLGAIDLISSEREEIVAELAAHLEDVYEAWRAEGLSESRAMALAVGEVSNWRELRRRIRRAKHKEIQVNQRTNAVWVPGLISLTLASGALALLQVWGVKPQIVWLRSGLALLFYVPWLIAQPAFGAIGAYISRRNGGDWRERLTAGLLPAACMVAAFCVIVCVQIAMNVITNTHEITFVGLGLCILSWAALPGLALALGTLPFLREEPTRQIS